MSEQRNLKWTYNLMETSQDSRGNRLMARYPYCAELTNIDGRNPGGVKPFPGFTRYRWLGKEVATYNEYYSRGAGYPTSIQVDFAPSAVDQPSEVWDLFPFSVRMGVDETIRGFVVRGKDSDDPAVPYVFVEYYWQGAWYFQRISDPSGNPTWAVGDRTDKMSVVQDGRLLYIAQRNQPTLVMYFNPTEVESSPYTFTDPIVTVQHTGPGELDDYPLEVNSTTALDAYTGTVRIMDITAGPTIDEVPAYGTGANFGANAAARTHAQAEVDYDNTPSNLTSIYRKLGRLGKGDLVFCYQLYNKNTGRLSQFSENAAVRVEDFEDETPVSHYFLLQISPAHRASLVAAGWTHIYIYRSLAAQDAGNALTMALKFEEAFLSIEDSDAVGDDATHVVSDTTSPDAFAEGSFIRWFKLTDNSIVTKNIALDTVEFDAEMPYSGAIVNYNGMMITASNTSFGGERADSDARTGVGEIRWSSASRSTLQLFPSENRWIDEGVYEEPHTLLLVGDRVLGVSLNRQYLVYRSGAYVVAGSQHKGWGCPSIRGAVVAGSSMYVPTSTGIITVDTSGVMNAVTAMDEVFVRRWTTDLEDVVGVFDSFAKAVFFLNTERRQAVVLWFTTSMASEMVQMPFATAASGQIPEDWNGLTEGEELSFWVMNDGRLMVPQWTRPVTDRGSWLDQHYNLSNEEDFARSFIGTIATHHGANEITIVADTPGGLPTDNPEMDDSHFVGTYMTVCDGSDAARFGRIVSVVSSTTSSIRVLVSDDFAVTSDDVGTKVFVNGLYTKVTGAALGYTMEQGEEAEGFRGDTGDFFRMRTAQSIAAFIEPIRPTNSEPLEEGIFRVESSVQENEARWWGYVLKNLSNVPWGHNTAVGGGGLLKTQQMMGSEPFQGAVPLGNHGVRGARLFPVFETVTSWTNWIMPAMQVSGNVASINREGLKQ